MGSVQHRRRRLAEESDGASSFNTPDVLHEQHDEILQCVRTHREKLLGICRNVEQRYMDYLQEVWKTMQNAVKRV